MGLPWLHSLPTHSFCSLSPWALLFLLTHSVVWINLGMPNKGQREWFKWLKFIFSWQWRGAGHSQNVTGIVFAGLEDGFLLMFVCLQDLPLCSYLLPCKGRDIGVWPASFTWPYFTFITFWKALSKTFSFWGPGIKIQHAHFLEDRIRPMTVSTSPLLV